MQRSMFTDLYAFTMGAAYVQEGTSEQQVTCEMFVRRLPRNRRFMVASGLQGIATWLSDWRLDSGDIEFLRQLPALRGAMTPAVVDRFRRLRFTGDLWMMPEGTLFFPDQPVLRITAPIIEAQLFETYALSVFNHSASIASKAARVMFAAQGKPVVEFGMRRVNPDASLEASRVAFMMGLEATSNVAAALVHDLPATGTMAHAWVMVHETEDEAFRQFVKTFPKSATMLVDTYDTLEGVKRAIKIAGPALGAVCIALGGPALGFALNGASFVVAGLCLLGLPWTSIGKAPGSARPGILGDMREGLATVAGSTWLWATISLAALGNLVLAGPMQIALPFLLREERGEGATAFAVFLSFAAVGSVGTALVLGSVQRIRRRGPLAYIGLIGNGVMLVILGQDIPIPALWVAGLFGGICLTLFDLIWINTIQELVPKHLLGRVFSVDQLGSFALLPFGFAFTGWATNAFGAAEVLVISGAALTLLAALGLLAPTVRHLD